MNKKLLLTALAISAMTLIGCDTTANRVDEKAISIKKLENAFDEEVKEDIDENSDIDVRDLDGDGKDEYIVKYKTKESESPLRIMILNEENGIPVIRDEIKNVGKDFDDIKYIDINNDGNLEIIAGFKAGDNLSKGISIYEYKDGKAVEVFEEYYSRYILRNINEDDRKEVVIIKEKEGKSYAYLYRCGEKGLENTRKVEIDSTLDSEEDILKKLFEN